MSHVRFVVFRLRSFSQNARWCRMLMKCALHYRESSHRTSPHRTNFSINQFLKFFNSFYKGWSTTRIVVSSAWEKGDPAEIFWKYFQNKWFSWSYKTTNLTEKWRNCWVFWRKSRYFDWFKYGFSITPTEFITYFQNISAGSPFLKSLNRSNKQLPFGLHFSISEEE